METSTKPKATRLLWDDHNKVRELYRALCDTPGSTEKARLAGELLEELEIHSLLEERIAYPGMAELGADTAMVRRFGQDHGEVRRLISAYRIAQDEEGVLPPDGQALLGRLMSAVQRHIAEEEEQAFPMLDANITRNETMGAELVRLRLKLKTFPPVVRRIDLGVPVRAAYDQWTQFEAFPRFLENVKEVRQLDDTRVWWLAEVGGREIHWTAEIYEQVPDRRIAWTSVDGALNAGAVSFRPLSPQSTRMLVEIAYEPQGLLEDLGALVGLVSRRIGSGLEDFRTYIETHMKETGGWRGTVEGDPAGPHLPPPGASDEVPVRRTL